MIDMTYWCESCARKNNCYTIRSRPKCFTPITNTASGTPESYLAKSLRYSQDSHEIAKDEPQTCSVNGRPYDCGKCEYFRCTADEPQTERPCDNCQEFDCYGCEYKQTEREGE